MLFTNFFADLHGSCGICVGLNAEFTSMGVLFLQLNSIKVQVKFGGVVIIHAQVPETPFFEKDFSICQAVSQFQHFLFKLEDGFSAIVLGTNRL